MKIRVERDSDNTSTVGIEMDIRAAGKDLVRVEILTLGQRDRVLDVDADELEAVVQLAIAKSRKM